MKNIARYFVKRPVVFWSMVAAIIIAGVMSYQSMPKLEDPAVTVQQAIIVVPYPGADAHQAELEVAQLLEEELRTVPDVQEIKSECTAGRAMVTVVFKMSVLKEEVQQYFDILRRKVSALESRLPQGCHSPIVIDDIADVYGIFYSFTSDGYTYPEMYRYARYIRRELLTVKGVKRVSISGNRDEVINVIVSKDKIARNGMLPMQIASALKGIGTPFYSGETVSGEDRLAFRVHDLENTDDIRNLMLTTFDGRQMRLGDVATVEKTFSEPQRNGFFIDGKPSLAICVAMDDDAIVPDVGKAVDRKLEEVMKNVPAGMETGKVFFQPEQVSSAISGFLLNLLESVLIVILVLIFTMGLKSGIIIGFGMILTIALSFPVLLGLGTTLQRISLGAFIVAMGMLVDNAIVIMDGILVDKKKNLGPDIYLYRTGKNTALPLLGATIIAVSTFLCIYLSPDSAGEYAGDLFLVLCVSLLASWLLALVQVPFCANAWLSKTSCTERKEDAMDSKIHRFFRQTVSLLIGHRWCTISVACVLLAICTAGLSGTRQIFFPDFNYSQFIVECDFPVQTDPDAVRELLVEMSGKLLKNPEIHKVTASMGSAPARYCLVRPMTSGGDSYGELLVDCKDYKGVVSQMPIVREMLREAYPDCYIRLRKYNFSVSTSHNVEVRFSGPDPAVLRDLSAQAEDIMRKCPYVDPYSVQNDWKPKSKTMACIYDEVSGGRSGITRGDIANSLQAAGDGLTIGVLNNFDRTELVNLLVRNEDGSRISDFSGIPVWKQMNISLNKDDLSGVLSGTADMAALQDRMFRSVPMSSVTKDISPEWEESIVKRVNGERSIEAECDPDPDNPDATTAKVLEAITPAIESIVLPEGYSLHWTGENEVQEEATANIMKYLPITIFLILAIMLLLFGSWKKVMLILLCLPFVICGITPALLLTGSPFTFMAMLGFFGLMGMMVKNAIVLVDEIGRQMKVPGQQPCNAVINATVSRVRPVLLASLTTIVGMIPLLGDPMYGSLAVTIIGGLAVGTVITLILIPVFYTAIFRIKKA